VGLDNHRLFSRLTARDAQNQVLFRQRLEHTDRQRLGQELARFQPGTPFILEGSFGWQWMTDELITLKLDPHLANCRKVDHWREARGTAKNNRIDADLLSELWPQEPRWWEVWLAPQPVRDWRELLRYRMGLVQIQTMTKNRIHALLHRYGIIHGFARLFGVRGKAFLEMLAQADQPLRPNARLVLAGHLRLLEQVRKQIAAVTLELRRQVQRNPQAELWRSLPGIDWVLAYTLQAEVGDPRRFQSGRRLCSYSLLAPIAEDSGDEEGPVPLGRHVGHLGRHTLKWAFIEAARGAVRKRDPLLLGIFNRRTDNGTRDKNRGYIAVARKLAEVGLACVKHQRAYSPIPPPRPGSVVQKESNPEAAAKKNKAAKKKPGGKTKRASVRSLGQPEHPMAGAGL
jgi:transposase